MRWVGGLDISVYEHICMKRVIVMRDVKEVEREMQMHFKNGDYDARNALVSEWRTAFTTLENPFIEGEEVEYWLKTNDWRRTTITKIVSNSEIHTSGFGIVPITCLRKKTEKHEQMSLL